jgi:hypothetical protein
MTFNTWAKAVETLDEATRAVTPDQRRLAEYAGLALDPQLPALVAAAKLESALASELCKPEPARITEGQEETLGEIAPANIYPQNGQEAAAWIQYLRLMQRRQHLATLALNAGDVVRTQRGSLAVVSSIGTDGRVYFKGGYGNVSWPDLLSVVTRENDTSEEAARLRTEANNQAAAPQRAAAWSMAKQQDLTNFAVETGASEDEVAQLESVIDGAGDERPIQEFLERRRHLLTALLTGHKRYCLAQKRLGSEFVPDFIIGDIDSLGIHWFLIELETPRSGVYLKDGQQLDQKARKGVDQIIAWRDWLTENLEYVRRRRSEHGLGLFDITSHAPAIVIVGTRSLIPETSHVWRREYRENFNIQIHTYDWLIEALRGAIGFQGLPGANRFVLERPSMNDVVFPPD